MFVLILSLFFVFLNGQTPVTMPPSPPVSYCSSIGGYDISGAANIPDKYTLPGSNSTAFVAYSLCGTVSMACGEAGMPCAGTSTGCCGMCQGWVEADGPQTACLGKFTQAQVVGSTVQVQYDGGDAVQQVPRRGLINIACGPGGSQGGNPNVMPTLFTQATGHEPNQPYIYTLDITSPVACGGIGGGWITILLLLFVFIPVYLVGGFLANKFYFMKESEASFVEYLPNYEFWCDTPGLFLEGISFTKSKIMSLLGRESSY